MENDRLMTCERLLDVLDEYLDGGGGEATRQAVEAHLSACPSCPALVADVRALRAAARALEPAEPPAHVWQQLRARIAAEAPPPSLLDRLGLSFSGPVRRSRGEGGWRGTLQPIAAAAGLVLVIASVAWIGGQLSMTPPSPRTASSAAALVEFQLAEAEYTDAIARLEDVTASAGPRLDAITSETLRASIDDADLAIGDARDALAREPDDSLSQESLLDALSSKVALLQDTVALLGDLEPATEEQTP